MEETGAERSGPSHAEDRDVALERARTDADHLRRLTHEQRTLLDRRTVRLTVSVLRRVDRLRSLLPTAGSRRPDPDGGSRSAGTNRSPGAGLRIEIVVAVPTRRAAPRWGDWHLAEAFARALRARGHTVAVRRFAERLDDTVDVQVVLRGTTPVPRRGAGVQILWVISHPESVTDEECDDADLVLVASSPFAAHLRTRTTTPVEVFHQATDHHRFRPHEPVAEHAHPVTAVAANRHGSRPSVRYAVDTGLRPAIYGGGWEGVVPDGLIVSAHVSNETLPLVYASAGVLLNDHWDTMKAWGFVSNRIFDGLACATPIVSDRLPEIADLFGDAVVCFDGPTDLRAAVQALLDDPAAARARAEEGRRIVVAHHTFEVRARELAAVLERYGLLPVG